MCARACLFYVWCVLGRVCMHRTAPSRVPPMSMCGTCDIRMLFLVCVELFCGFDDAMVSSL